jgi:hypothetical protein
MSNPTRTARAPVVHDEADMAEWAEAFRDIGDGVGYV